MNTPNSTSSIDRRPPRHGRLGHRAPAAGAVACAHIVTHAELDLTDQVPVHRYFGDRRIAHMVPAAAKLGRMQN